MSITPEQWRQLEAQRIMPRHGRGADELARLMVLHADDLIAASRPKCLQCGGNGDELEPSRSDPWGWDRRPCPNCNGTGWAT